MNFENKKQEFEAIIKESPLRSELLVECIKEFKGRLAPYPGDEIYLQIEENTDMLKRINEPSNVKEFIEGKKNLTLEDIAEFLVEKGIIQFIHEEYEEDFGSMSIVEMTRCVLTKKGQEFLIYLGSGEVVDI